MAKSSFVLNFVLINVWINKVSCCSTDHIILDGIFWHIRYATSAELRKLSPKKLLKSLILLRVVYDIPIHIHAIFIFFYSNI